METSTDDTPEKQQNNVFSPVEPEHLFRLCERDRIRVQTEYFTLDGYATEEGDLEKSKEGETYSKVRVRIATRDGDERYATLFCYIDPELEDYTDPSEEGMVVDVLGAELTFWRKRRFSRWSTAAGRR